MPRLVNYLAVSLSCEMASRLVDDELVEKLPNPIRNRDLAAG